MDNTPIPNQEIEATLVICSEAPDAVADRISSIRELAGCSVSPGGSVHQHDRYFDTPGLAFNKAGWGFRIRQTEGAVLVAVKGPATLTDWGGLSRPEIEGPWSPETFSRINDVLADLGVLRAHPDSTWTSDPLAAMTTLGLGLIQDRCTRREIRHLKAPYAPDIAPLAELVVDFVVYRFSEVEIRHVEVEVEAGSTASAPVLRAIVQELLTRFGESLRLWDHNKLVIGLVLADLLNRGEMDSLLSNANALLPRAYDKLETILGSGRQSTAAPCSNG